MELGRDGALPIRWSVRKTLQLIDRIEANLRSIEALENRGRFGLPDAAR
jgi:hypothetical protein